MWRAIPLFKMVGRMVGACVPLSIAEHLVYELWPLYGSARIANIDRILWHAIEKGAYWGITIGILIALVTAILYRQTPQLTYYVFAMVIVATVVTIATQPISLSAFIRMTEQMPDGDVWLFA